MTETVNKTDATYIDHIFADGKFALTDRGEVIWHHTIFTRYGGLPAGDIAMAGMTDGLGFLSEGGNADAGATLAFARKHDLAERYVAAVQTGKALETVNAWLTVGGGEGLFGLVIREGVSSDVAAQLEAEIDAARQNFWAVKAEAKAEFDAAAQRFEAAIGGDFEVAKLQENQIVA